MSNAELNRASTEQTVTAESSRQLDQSVYVLSFFGMQTFFSTFISLQKLAKSIAEGVDVYNCLTDVAVGGLDVILFNDGFSEDDGLLGWICDLSNHHHHPTLAVVDSLHTKVNVLSVVDANQLIVTNVSHRQNVHKRARHLLMLLLMMMILIEVHPTVNHTNN